MYYEYIDSCDDANNTSSHTPYICGGYCMSITTPLLVRYKKLVYIYIDAETNEEKREKLEPEIIRLQNALDELMT